MKPKAMINALKKKQNELQKWFEKNVDKGEVDGFDYRNVWIHVQCRCGHSFPTPWYVRDDGLCPKCSKSIIRVIK